MARDTLLDFFDDLASASGEFLVYDDGYRTRRYAYAAVGNAARAFAARLDRAGFRKGDAVVLWGENRPEWVAALWGCLLRGVVAVPIDYRASVDFLERVRGIVRARLVLAGDEVPAMQPAADVAVWPLRDLLEPEAILPPEALEPVAITPDDVAEIIFTSGATAEPKGVVITHRNILANIVPIEREVAKYRAWARPFRPIRFLNLLPLSHMFGQAMATFIPPMLPGTVVFMHGYSPHEIVRQARTRRVSVLVCVPKVLDVLRSALLRQHPELASPPPDRLHWTRRWWRYRAVHRAFGWKFWALVVGAAPLDAGLELFMRRLGFVVIQGYGLTETAPIVTLNHPFSTSAGSVGKPIAGVEVRIAADGEILVRGDNVTRGYFGAPRESAEAFSDGWLHTGDIGSVDEQGRLFIRGRKKEMIVTPEGLNVFPEDVEQVLNALPGVVDSAVVGRAWDGEERVHAVLLLASGADPHAVVREANQRLVDHQKIKSVSVWPGAELPRTEGTRKLKRRQIRASVDGTATGPGAAGSERPSVEAVVARFARGASGITGSTTLDELGLSSLERVELLMALEDRFQATIDERAFAAARSVDDLRGLVAPVVSARYQRRAVSDGARRSRAPGSWPRRPRGSSARSSPRRPRGAGPARRRGRFPG